MPAPAPAPAPAPPAASFASADEAMDCVRAGLGYLAQADAAALPAVTQARLLREYERAQSRRTAGRAKVLTGVHRPGRLRRDGHGGPHPWLAWQTRVTARAASGTIGWMRRLGAHPRVAAALASGAISESYARKVCDWSDLLPFAYRDGADEYLVDPAADGLDLDFLSQMAEQMYSRVTPPDNDDRRRPVQRPVLPPDPLVPRPRPSRRRPHPRVPRRRQRSPRHPREESRAGG